MKSPAHDIQILIVDDNPLVRELMCRRLEPLCTIMSATDGADALLKAIDNPPDLILSDFRMPGLDGRQLFEKLRGREGTRHIPFIFVASRGDIEEKLRPLGRTLCGRSRKSWTASIWKRCRRGHRVQA
jgi:CheY-like chemotaxis protein